MLRNSKSSRAGQKYGTRDGGSRTRAAMFPESRPAQVRIMDADAFSMLTGGGVKFDRQRFAKDFTSLAQPKPRPVIESLAAGPGPSSAAAQTTGHRSTAKREPPAARLLFPLCALGPARRGLVS